MAAVNVSKVTRSFLRGYPVSFRTMATSTSKTTQSHLRPLMISKITGAKQVVPLVNPAFRQPMALLSTEATPKKKAKTVNITFIDRDGDEQTVQAKVGDTLLEVAKEYDIDLEGACEGTLSCSTCHLVVDPEWYDKIPDPLTEEEQDMLDLAYGLTDMSRLGCQILVSEKLEGLKLTVPAATRDIRNL